MAKKNIQIDADRLWKSIHEMAEIGPGIAGGNNRQALTDEDGEARTVFQSWCEDAGCTVGVDQLGNMFALRAGEDESALPVCMGSHLDTQPTGGRYDGILGVLGGLEAIRSMNELGIRTKHPIMVVNWTNEEGTRFAPPMLASGVVAGKHGVDWAYDRVDENGLRFGDELDRIGWKGSEPVGARKMKAMFELHIEQGPILEAEGIDIGVVTHGQGLRWIEFTVMGKDSHTGSTPMHMRKDAGLAMGKIIDLVHRTVMAEQPNAVGTIGHINVHPNSRNVIAGRAVFTVDLRSNDLSKLENMSKCIVNGVNAICASLGCTATHELVGAYDPPTFDKACVDAVRNAAIKQGYTHRDIVSGAGHDAFWINEITPTAMIMCPCVDGLSHNEAEEISKDWAAAGADVLLHAVLEIAEIVD